MDGFMYIMGTLTIYGLWFTSKNKACTGLCYINMGIQWTHIFKKGETIDIDLLQFMCVFKSYHLRKSLYTGTIQLICTEQLSDHNIAAVC